MVFSEPAFLFYFLPLVVGLHTAAPRGLRNPLLLLASLLFYASGEPVHVGLLLVSIAVNTAAGLAIGATTGARRGTALAAGVTANLLILGWFKYAGFVAGAFGLNFAEPALPIGISFFTFQALSYLVDVSRGAARVQPSPLTLGLYISMFPQLIAGPIVRYHDVEGQLRERSVDLEGFAGGIRRFVIGLSKKMFIANTLAKPADAIFALPGDDLTAGLAWLAVAAYSLQIYFDFSGYSDMAIGLGRMFGFRYPENFRHPYESRSVREFWRRWHISLSTWFRDYLYLPLGGNRRGPVRVAFNLWTVFLLCGLWHGASVNFLVWGALHGLFLATERGLAPGWTGPLAALAGRVYTLTVVAVGWVIFRAETMGGAADVLAAAAGFGGGNGLAHSVPLYADATVWTAFATAVPGCTSLPGRALRHAAEALRAQAGAMHWLPDGVEAAALLLLLVGCAALVAADTYNPFIYFRF